MSEMYLIDLYSRSYLTENTSRLHYKDQTVTVASGNIRCLSWKVVPKHARVLKITRVHKLARVPRRQNTKLKLNFYYKSSKDSSHFSPLSKFAIITAIFMKIQFFWAVASRRVDSYRRCEGSCCLHLQGQPVQEELTLISFLISSEIC